MMSTRTYWNGGRRNRHPVRLRNRERYSTCCNILSVKTGTVVLGIFELIAIAGLFNEVVRQLLWKNKDLENCIARKWKDCVIFHFSHFNLTLVSDYLVALLLCLLFLCVLLLIYGILVVQPKYLRPHLIVQAVGLILSLAYFILYGWSYFYGDIYTQKRRFSFEFFVERMWLSSLLLVFFFFQCYLFFVVVKCSLYLNIRRMERNVRKMQFQEVSNRVKQAKENGLWRSTSWGGGFQQYKGQHEKEHSRRRQANNIRTVQWDLERNIENSLSAAYDSSNSHENSKPYDAKISRSASAMIPTVISSTPISTSLVRIGFHSPWRDHRGGNYEPSFTHIRTQVSQDAQNRNSDRAMSMSNTFPDPCIVKKVSIWSRFPANH